MAQTIRFAVVLVVGLSLLAWGASRVVNQTIQTWFERDINLRAQLAVLGASHSLAAQWSGKEADAVRATLTEITRDERIMAAAACASDLTLLAATEGFPKTFSCQAIGQHVRPVEGAPPNEWRTWGANAILTGGEVHLSAVPISYGPDALGFIMLIHDLSFIGRREAKAQQLILIAFGILAVSAAALTVIAGRLFWRGWTREIRKFLRGGTHPRHFQPILGDVRELIARISSEAAMDDQGHSWTAQRLRQVLTQHLHGERIVILANREPYIHERTDDGLVRVVHPASGLVTALEPVLRACSGVWVAHGGGKADRETADVRGRLRVPPGEESYLLRRVWLSSNEEKGYYYGFANEGLWPLCHLAHTRPSFRSDDWDCYRAVNQKFVDAVCEEVDTDDPVILVQDYHYALAPQMIRKRLPRAMILTFWHIPWPNAERLGICPWRAELVAGLLGSSVMAFQTQWHCNNFLESVDRFLEARIDRAQFAAIHQTHTTLVRAYPISIEWPNRWATAAPAVEECRAGVFAELHLRSDALLGVGVDRLDYTKGIEERLWAVARCLERFPALRGRLTFVQLAAPSRTVIERYRRLNESIEQIAAQINKRFGTDDYRPVVLLEAHHEPPNVFRFYRAADFCYVSSLHDGMNLVAKEFVAARDDEKGVLVLSQFTGAARELTEALIVNPYDFDEASSAMAAAANMPAEEQRERMRAMRAFVAEFNVYRWAGRMLIDASRLRARERLVTRLGEGVLVPHA